MAPQARITIGRGCFLNRETMLAAHELIEIGDHVMFANHCFVGDADHKYDDPDLPITWQGFKPRGPVKNRLERLARQGRRSSRAAGTIGDRCVVGSNSVVTKDLPEATIAAGVPAKILREIQFIESKGRGRWVACTA